MKIASILLVILPFIKPAITDVNSNVSIVTPQEIDNQIILKCNFDFRDLFSFQEGLSDFAHASYFKKNPSYRTSFTTCEVDDKETLENDICCIGKRIGKNKYVHYTNLIKNSEYIDRVIKSCQLACIKHTTHSSTKIAEIINCCKSTDPKTPCDNFKLIKINYTGKQKQTCLALLKDETCLEKVLSQNGIEEHGTGVSVSIQFIRIVYKEPINKNEDSKEEKIIEVETNKEEN